ncbi:tRNA dihydrouridine(20/20a) synthase DusA [Microbaculum marinum]|uniref:tRNA-dihydrouridine(20/20a) synthase n=1 Tax=Microbaculum marinum TaxID=1764581 RepID=A0AAW9RGZ7_9HYPH
MDSEQLNAREKTFSVAPMIDWTDRHCRYFHRLLSRRARLYTEMITSAAILHGDRDRLLGCDPSEHPNAVQLGGSSPSELAEAARIAESYGYDEINLNVGCPSDRVQSGRFGACLMAEPDLVAACVEAMKSAVRVPVTVKCRLGIDDQDTGAPLDMFTAKLVEAGVDALVVHARKAWLKGLSPKENREIPPLDRERVHRLKETFPDLPVILNGGLGSLEEALPHMGGLDGVMLGRAAYRTPAILRDVDLTVFSDPTPPLPYDDVIAKMHEYACAQAEAGVPLHHVTRPMLGLFHGEPGARQWRRLLSVDMQRPDARPGLLLDAYSRIRSDPGRVAA